MTPLKHKNMEAEFEEFMEHWMSSAYPQLQKNNVNPFEAGRRFEDAWREWIEPKVKSLNERN